MLSHNNHHHNHHHDSSNKFIVSTLAKDYTLFIGTRGVAIFLFFSTYINYQRTNINNLTTSADLSIVLNIMNVVRELMSPVTNDIKDAVNALNNNDPDATNTLIHLYRVSFFSGINPFIISTICTQTYVLLIPILGRDNSQLMFLPLLFSPQTMTLMMLTAQYNYGTMRGDNMASLLFLLGSSVILAGSAYVGSLFDSSANYLMTACLIQTGSYVIANSIYLAWKYPKEKLTQALFNTKEWKRSFIDACKVNWLGLQPTLVISAETVGNILITQFLNTQGLKAFQPLSSIYGIGNGIAQTVRQRNQALTRHLLNTLKSEPKELRSALRKVLVHSSWIGVILPALTAGAAWIALDYFMTALYNPTPEKEKIVDEARMNWFAPFIIFAERMLAAGPGGMIFATRSSADKLHKKLNAYLTWNNVINPIAAASLGIGLDYFFNLSSSGFWISLITLNAVAGVMQYGLAWKLIDYEYTQGLIAQNENPEPAANAWSLAWPTTFWSKGKTPEVQYIPLEERNKSRVMDI